MSKRADSIEDECVICFGEEGESDIYFSPCAHKACKVCVQKLRVANVYKADKGVKCPICRQIIEGYLDSPPKSLAVVSSGGKPFRAFELGALESRYGRGGITSIGNGNDYIPPKGVTGTAGGLRINPKQDDFQPGYVVPPLKADSDILAMAMDKTGARHLDYMLRDGYPKRHKVAKICREVLTPFVAKLAVHGYGNFVFQRMLEYAATHRGDAANGECFFTAIVRSLCRDDGLVMAAQDLRGTFSVQKMVVLMHGSDELRLVLTGLRGSVVLLSLHQQGVYLVERLVEFMIASLNSGHGKKPRVPGNEAVNGLAQLAAEMTNEILKIGKHQVSGTLLVECIRWSLPHSESLAAAMMVVNHAKQLLGSRYAHRTLQGILSLEVKQVAEGLISALEGEFGVLVFDVASYGWKLVRASLATRCVDERNRLLIMDELLGRIDHSSAVVDIQHGYFDVLAFGLSILTRRRLDDRLEMLKFSMPKEKFKRFSETVESMRNNAFPPSSALQQSQVPSGYSVKNCPWKSVAIDSWTEDQSANTKVPTVPASAKSEGLLPDTWEQIATSSSTTCTTATSTGLAAITVYTPPHLRGISTPLPPDVPYHTPLTSVKTTPTPSQILPLHLPIVKPGTYAPPHVRQALGVINAVNSTSESPLKVETSDLVEKVAIGDTSQGVYDQMKALEKAMHQSTAMCALCRTHQTNSVLLDCSHMCCCLICAYTVSLCPVCQQPVRQVLELKPFSDALQKPATDFHPESDCFPAAKPFPASSETTTLRLSTSARELLPSDLYETLSLNCDIPDTPDLCSSSVNEIASVAPSYAQPQSNQLPPRLDTYSLDMLKLSQKPLRNVIGTCSRYSFAQGVDSYPIPGLENTKGQLQHGTRVRRPYRPPDVFRV